MAKPVRRADVLRFRVAAQQLDRETASGSGADTALLDVGAQDTGPDGARWALAVRGLPATVADDELVWLWTIRGAPHAYRRSDVGAVAAAVAPMSERDAAKRIFDAAKPLREAGIGALEALDAVGGAMHRIVTKPMSKGDVSTRLTKAMPPPYVRDCRPCRARHLYEMTFRLGALRGGLELEPGTSPPVLRRIPRFRRAASATPKHDPVRGYLRVFGPATHKQVAQFVDAPVRDVTDNWPEDAVEIDVEGEQRWALADDVDRLRAGCGPATHLLGPYDLYLQGRDRDLLVGDAARAKALWPVIGRPGAVLRGADLAGLWRPRTSGKGLSVAVDPWVKVTAAVRRDVQGAAERLAEHRGVPLVAVTGLS